MKKIAIYGAGGFGREVANLIDDINSHERRWEIVGFFDDEKSGETVNGHKVLGGIIDLNNTKDEMDLVVAVGWPGPKKKIIENITNPHIRFATLIHPSVIMSQCVEVGAGSIICAGSILTVDIRIGRHVIVNLNCTVGHDAVIGDYCSLMPGVDIAGQTQVGAGSFMGTGALIINQKKIGANSIVGAGAVVIADIPANCTAVGNPARIVNK